MDIQTKYNLGNKVSFHPFNNKELNKRTGKIHAIDCKVTGMNKITIEYIVKEANYTLWHVDEEAIL